MSNPPQGPTSGDPSPRLAQDSDLIKSLAAGGFEGPEYDAFAEELARYGLGVMKSWIGTRQVFHECRKKHLQFAQPLPYTEETAADLAADTVASALGSFREKILLTDRWNPDGGASLSTYFTGHCLIAFVGVYAKWTRTVDTALAQSVPLEEGDGSRPDTSLDNLAYQELLASIPDDRTRSAVVLRDEGWEYAEIAEILETTPKAASRLVERQRVRWRNNGVG